MFMVVPDIGMENWFPSLYQDNRGHLDMIQPQVYGIESRLEGISVIVLLYY